MREQDEHLEANLRMRAEMRRQVEAHNQVARPFHYAGVEDLVLREGTTFAPEPLPPELSVGTIKECFSNALMAVYMNPDLDYVEGIASSIIPVHHAWVAPKGRDVAWDVTWPPELGDGPEDRAYRGIRVPREIASYIVTRRGYHGLFEDWQNDWPLLRQPWDLEAAREAYAGVTPPAYDEDYDEDYDEEEFG